jgi:hypothetical protein
MTRGEWIEVLVIGLIAPTTWLVWPPIPSSTPVWNIVLGISALLLMQSLVRDIAILFCHWRSASNEPRKEAQCFCLESTVGSAGIVAGAVLAGLDISTQVPMGRWDFFLAVAGTMALGFIIKDLVISWKPFGVRREKDHLNLIVRWKTRH